MVRFVPGPDGVFIADGHDHKEADLHAGLNVALAADRNQALAATARLSETWYSEAGGYGHDCSAHKDIERRFWSPHCGTFRPVTVATVPVPARVERAGKAA